MATAMAVRLPDVTTLARAHQVEIWRYLRYLGCDAALAEDLTQETFLAVLERPFEERDAAQTSAYLRGIARHKFLKSLRRRETLDLQAAENTWVTLAGLDGGETYLEALKECLAGLDARAGEAVAMQYRDGRSREEIAARLGLAVEGVKTLLRRAKETLRGCVKGKIGRE